MAAMPSPDEQKLRDRVGELELELQGLERELSAAEGERDAAEAIAESVRARSGGSVELWRAEEQAAEAQARIRDLLGRAAPLKVQYTRLSSYLAPIDKERDELEATRRALAGWEKLAEVLPLLDHIAAAVAAAEKAGQDSRGEFAVPEPLRYLVRQLGPNATGMGRHRVELAIRTHVEGKRERLARLTGGAQ